MSESLGQTSKFGGLWVPQKLGRIPLAERQLDDHVAEARQAIQDIEQAIQDEEMDIPRYNEIASRMQTDMELRQRAQQVN